MGTSIVPSVKAKCSIKIIFIFCKFLKFPPWGCFFFKYFTPRGAESSLSWKTWLSEKGVWQFKLVACRLVPRSFSNLLCQVNSQSEQVQTHSCKSEKVNSCKSKKGYAGQKTHANMETFALCKGFSTEKKQTLVYQLLHKQPRPKGGVGYGGRP